MEKVLVTGAAGFIGSHLVDRLLADGRCVVGFDNFSTGTLRYLENALDNPNFQLVTGDLLDQELLIQVMCDIDTVYHMAANADIRGGTENTKVDIEQNTVGTYNVMEAMRISSSAAKICFASSAAALGEPEVFPTPENLAVPKQTSLYGASKMAGEGIISAFCNAFDIEGYCFRFVSLLGPRYPHGHVFDFVNSLRRDASELKILGDGTAEKSYLHIYDCIDALMLVCEEKKPARDKRHKFDVFNLGVEDFVRVADSAAIISEELDLNPVFSFGEGRRGWVGDNPFVFLDITKMKQLGWKPKFSIKESISITARWLHENQWIFEERT